MTSHHTSTSIWKDICYAPETTECNERGNPIYIVLCFFLFAGIVKANSRWGELVSGLPRLIVEVHCRKIEKDWVRREKTHTATASERSFLKKVSCVCVCVCWARNGSPYDLSFSPTLPTSSVSVCKCECECEKGQGSFRPPKSRHRKK